MEPTLHLHHHRRLLADLVRNGHDRRLGRRDRLLGPAACDLRNGAALIGLVEVDRGAGVVFDLVDGGAAFAEDAGDGAVGDGEFEDVVGFLFEFNSLRGKEGFISFCFSEEMGDTRVHDLGLGTCDALTTTFDEDLIVLEMFSCPALTALR